VQSFHRAENKDHNSLQGSRVGAVKIKKHFDHLASSLHETIWDISCLPVEES
jgi:hypothetical protein